MSYATLICDKFKIFWENRGVKMKYCMHCGAEIHDEAVVCVKCGCKVENEVPAVAQKGEEDTINVVIKVFLIFLEHIISP